MFVNTKRVWLNFLFLGVLLVGISACDSDTQSGGPVISGTSESPPDVANGNGSDSTPGASSGSADAEPPSEENIAHDRDVAENSSKDARARVSSMTFDEFEASVYKEPFEGGKYIVNGDTPIASRKRLMEFFETQIQRDPGVVSTDALARLVVHQEGGQDSVWNDTQKVRLSYCVSTNFGANHGAVVAEMQAAGAAWEQVADVNFQYLAAEDSACNANNQNVVFDVRSVDVSGQYLARAFFPHDARAARNVLIDDSSFSLDPNGTLTLTGILRHELGHTLGFRHEHTRPDSGTCFEDSDWRPLTDYDAFSVMHYPQCNGLGDWSLTLTHADSNGAACLYSPAPGFTVDTSICPSAAEPAPQACPSQTVTLNGEVSQGERDQHGPFAVAAGSVFEVHMAGTGDPDLYVNYGAEPTFSNYVCRPYLNGANEECVLDVPSGQTQAFIMVRGFTAGSYQLTVTHTPGG